MLGYLEGQKTMQLICPCCGDILTLSATHYTARRELVCHGCGHVLSLPRNKKAEEAVGEVTMIQKNVLNTFACCRVDGKLFIRRSFADAIEKLVQAGILEPHDGDLLEITPFGEEVLYHVNRV